MLYRIHRASLACIQEVSCIHGVYDCIYLNKNKIEAYFNHNMRRDVWLELPPYIRERVEARFKQMFDAPLEQRQALIDRSINADIFIEETP